MTSHAVLLDKPSNSDLSDIKKKNKAFEQEVTHGNRPEIKLEIMLVYYLETKW